MAAVKKPLPVENLWSRELEGLNCHPNWGTIWSNLTRTSNNLSHQLIHYKVIHRAYATPYRRYIMKLQPDYYCQFCNNSSPGSFLHMFWECPVVSDLWAQANSALSNMLEIDYASNPCLCLLNDDSNLTLRVFQKRMLFAGFTAVKKTILQHWITPDISMYKFWIGCVQKIVNLEWTTLPCQG